MFKNNRALKRSVRAFAFVFFFSSCAPKITNFTATPATITKGDSVLLNWKIKGKPTVMFDQRKIAHPPGDSLDILEFILSVQKDKKVKYIKRQVSLLPKESSDRVVLITNDLHGDTLIAAGLKDTILWSEFEIISVSSLSARPVIVIHANKKSVLKNPEIPSDIWQGMPYGGNWQIMSIVTEEEKKDHSLIPNQLEIKVLIRPVKK